MAESTGVLRALTTALMFRSRLANLAGRTFGGKRDLYKALGYQRELWPWDYRSRFQRNAVANRIVKALPKDCWRGGGQIFETEDPTEVTAFEAAWEALEKRLRIWTVMQRADILAGIGRYSIILIGAPGRLEDPLLKAGPNDIAYLTPFAEEDAVIQMFDTDVASPRFGLPVYYTVKRTTMQSTEAINSAVVGRRVHWTRCLHVADGLLDDNIYGEPRLQCCWNLLDDLEKVTGGGAEAFWRRADQGVQFELDPTLDVKAEDLAALKEQVEEYEHDLRRYLTTRGVTVNSIGSDVADFSSPVSSIISQISAGTGIPQRVLMGSEQGKLAAKMDRSNWDDRVANRRDDFLGPYIVRPFVDRLIELGVLPAPATGSYDVSWQQLNILDDEQRAIVAGQWAGLNTAAGETVVLPDEIRERVLELPPLAEVQTAEGDDTLDDDEPVAAAKGKGGAAGETHVHRVADRFRRTRTTAAQRLLRQRAKRELAIRAGRRA